MTPFNPPKSKIPRSLEAYGPEQAPFLHETEYGRNDYAVTKARIDTAKIAIIELLREFELDDVQEWVGELDEIEMDFYIGRDLVDRCLLECPGCGDMVYSSVENLYKEDGLVWCGTCELKEHE